MLSNAALAERLRAAIGRLARRLRQQALGGLTPSQASALSILDRHGAMTMGRLAENEGISAPSATGIVARLIEKELVVRTADPDDLRSTIVAITSEGQAVLKHRRQERTAYLAKRLDQLSDEDRITLERAVVILERLHEDP